MAMLLCSALAVAHARPAALPAALPSAHVARHGGAVAMAGGWADAQRRKREEQLAQFEALAKVKAVQDAANAQAVADAQREKEDAIARQNQKIAAYQDNVDLYRPGGVMRQAPLALTREMMANAQKVQSPAMLADEALKEALDANADAAALARTLEEARAAGLREGAPNYKKAVALLATLEAGGSLEAAAQPPSSPMDGSVDSKLDVLFGGGYSIPGMDDDDDEFPYAP